MLRDLVLLSLGACLLASAATSSAQPAFETIITDQPSFESSIEEAAGLSDGGFVVAGRTLIQTDDPLAPSRAVMVARHDIEGDVVWAKAYPEPELLRDYYGKTVQLALVGDTIYVLAVSHAAPDGSIQVSVRRVDVQTGAEVYRRRLKPGRAAVTHRSVRAFAVIDDAAVVVREPRDELHPYTDFVVEVFGLVDGSLRAEVLKPASYDDEATAWPAAGVVVIDPARQLTIDAAGDTTSLPYKGARAPNQDVLMFLASGSRAVYPLLDTSNRPSLAFATVDGGVVTTSVKPLPQEFVNRTIHDLTAWGPDSIAMTVGSQVRSIPPNVYIFGMDGSFGRVLPGKTYFFYHHNIDGPKHAVLREQVAAPRQRRVLARWFWEPDPLGVLDYTSGDTLALPIALSRVDPDFFDNLTATTLLESGDLLSVKVTGEALGDWFKFDNRGSEIPLAPRPSLAPEQFFSPQIIAFGDGKGYAVHNLGSYDFRSRVGLVDEDLVGEEVLYLSEGFASIAAAAPHPDGGIVYVLKQRDTFLLTHVSSAGVVRGYATFPPSAYGGGNPFLSDFAVGPSGEVALVGKTSTFPDKGRGFLIERGPDGTQRVREAALDPEFGYQVAWGPNGSLLVTNLRSDYWHYRLQPDGTFDAGRTGRFVNDEVLLVGMKLLDENHVVLSYNLAPINRPSRAVLGRYALATQELTELHESAPVSYARRLELTADGRVLQEISPREGYAAIVVSQGSVSPTREIGGLSNPPLAIRSPFTSTLEFSLDDNSDLESRTPAVLYDVAGREVLMGLPDAQGDGHYRLTVPRDLAPGIYTLRFGQRAGMCVKQ